MANLKFFLLISILLTSNLFADNRKDNIIRESVDLIEHNWFYDENGKEVFQQIIFYDWSWKEERYNVRAWRLIKCPEILPIKDWTNGGYKSMWLDGEHLREVRSKEIRETFSQYDPELLEREYLPKEKRKELKNNIPPRLTKGGK